MSAEELKLVEERVAGVVQENIKYEDLEKKYVEWAKLYDHVSIILEACLQINCCNCFTFKKVFELIL